MSNRLIDLSGKRFGLLTVIKRNGINKFKQPTWLCQCDCGKHITVIGNNLRKGTTRSCGCIKKTNLIGKKFGKLTVIDYAERPSHVNNTNAYWECLCDCGNKKIKSTADLVHNNTMSCGCYRKETMAEMAKRCNRIGYGESAFNRIYYDYKRGAKRRGYEFKLSKEEFEKISQENCHYCGAEPSRIYKTVSRNGDFIRNGIDRINNEKGYTIDNVVPCCTRCNQAKNNMGYNEFRNWVRSVCDHWADDEIIEYFDTVTKTFK